MLQLLLLDLVRDLDPMTSHLTTSIAADHLQIRRQRSQTRCPAALKRIGTSRTASSDPHLKRGAAKPIGCKGPSTQTMFATNVFE